MLSELTNEPVALIDLDTLIMFAMNNENWNVHVLDVIYWANAALACSFQLVSGNAIGAELSIGCIEV